MPTARSTENPISDTFHGRKSDLTFDCVNAIRNMSAWIRNVTPLFFFVASFRTTGCWMQSWLRIFACVSIIHHNRRQHDIIHSTHNLLSHFIGARAFTEALYTPFSKHTTPWLIPFYISVAYITYFYLQYANPIYIHLHFTMHLSAVIGILCLHRAVYET